MSTEHDERERFVRANGLLHHVLEWGPLDGPVIVLAHGWADVGASFTEVAQALVSRGYRVIAFDWRGFGQTEWVSGGGYYHFPDYVLDLAELTAALELRRYALVGHSMGGTASVMFAGSRPKELVSLVLAEGLGPPVSADSYDRRLREWIDGVRAMRQKEIKPMTGVDQALERLRVQHPDLEGELAARIVPRLLKKDERGFFFAFDPLHRTRSPMPFRLDLFEAVLSAIEVPVLIVSGDKGFRNEDHEARVGKIANVREAVMPGVGHMMHWHAPEAFAALIADHVGSVLLSGGAPSVPEVR